MENPDLHNDIDEAVIFAQIAEIVAQLKEISCNRSDKNFVFTYWQNVTSFKTQLFCDKDIVHSALRELQVLLGSHCFVRLRKNKKLC